MGNLLRLLVSYSIRRSKRCLLCLNSCLMRRGAIPIFLSWKPFYFFLNLWLNEMLFFRVTRHLLRMYLHLQSSLLVLLVRICSIFDLRLSALLLRELRLELKLFHDLLTGWLLWIRPLLAMLLVQAARAFTLRLPRKGMCACRVDDRALLHIICKLANHILRVLRKREMLLVVVSCWPIRISFCELLLLKHNLAVQVALRPLLGAWCIDLVSC